MPAPTAAPLGDGQPRAAGNPNSPANPTQMNNDHVNPGQILTPEQVAAQYPDPAAVGQQIAQSLGEQMQATQQQNQQFMQQQSQQNNELASQITNTLQTMQQQANAQLQHQNAPNYDQQFALSEQERNELGEVGATAVQKMVDRSLAQGADQIVDRAQQSSLAEINALKQQLAEAQQQIQAQQVDTSAQFRTQANTILAARQLDANQLQNDPTWQEFGSQVANTITGQNYASAMEAAITAQDLPSFTRVLDQYSQHVQASQQQPLAPAPGGMGTQARTFNPQQQQAAPDQITAALLEEQNKAHALRDRRMRTKISAEEFADGIKEINTRIEALQAQNPEQQPGPQMVQTQQTNFQV